jgi:hypothetical protein
LIGDVERYALRLATSGVDLRRDLLERAHTPRAENDRRSGKREDLRTMRTQAARGAGN